MKKWEGKTSTIIKSIAIVMLLGALGKLPYAYYQILKWVVCGVTGYSACLAYENQRIGWAWIFGIIAVLFNPIVPIYLERDSWAIIDVVVAIVIFVSLFIFKVGEDGNENFTELRALLYFLKILLGFTIFVALGEFFRSYTIYITIASPIIPIIATDLKIGKYRVFISRKTAITILFVVGCLVIVIGFGALGDYELIRDKLGSNYIRGYHVEYDRLNPETFGKIYTANWYSDVFIWIFNFGYKILCFGIPIITWKQLLALLDEAPEIPLISAIEVGNIANVKALLDYDFDVNEKDDCGRTPLVWAAKKGCTEIVQILLDKGSEIDIKDNSGFTALIAGAWEGHADVVQILLDNGAEVNARDYAGETALVRAKEKGHTEIVELIKKAGA